MIKKLEWDSGFFEIEIGELIYQKGLYPENTNDFDLLYVKSNNDFSFTLPGFNNDFSEEKIVFAKEMNQSQAGDTNIFPFEKINPNPDIIYNLAFESGKFSRFKLDKNFSENKFRELYKKWVDNSINKTFADDLLVYAENGNSLGFVTYKINKDTATIGLIAVSTDSQRKGIGVKLINAVERLLYKQNIDRLLIPTQASNTTACKFYTKLGYTIHEVSFIKHYWKNDTI